MSASLFDLPLELMDEVAHNLSSNNISRLSRTCKLIRSKTEKSLYRRIDMTWVGDSKLGRTILSPRIDLLLRTILEEPKYVQHVRMASFETKGFRPGRSRIWFTDILPPAETHWIDPVLLHNAVLSLNLEDEKWNRQWIAAIKSKRLDAIVALFVLKCPLIYSLTLGMDLVRLNRYLERALRSLFKEPPKITTSALQKLKHVQIGGRPGAIEYRYKSFEWRKSQFRVIAGRWGSFLPLLFGSDIETAEIAIIPNRTVDRNEFTLTRSTSLKQLIMPSTNLQLDPLGKILSYTPMLTRLEYDQRLYSWSSNIDGKVAEQVFSQVKNTLQHLKYVFRLAEQQYDRIGWFKHWCSFRDFSVLQSLHISPSLLLGRKPTSAPRPESVLPESLEQLCFHEDFRKRLDWQWKSENFMDWSRDYIDGENWRMATPNLMKYGVSDKDDWLRESDKEDLKDLLHHNGLLETCTARDIS